MVYLYLKVSKIMDLNRKVNGMPLLDFQCNTCGKKFDELIFSTNRDKIKCPSCGDKDLKQIYEGKCNFGKTADGGGNSGGCSGGNCSGCSGCK